MLFFQYHAKNSSQMKEECKFNWLETLKKISKIAIPIIIFSELARRIPTVETGHMAYTTCMVACDSVTNACSQVCSPFLH